MSQLLSMHGFFSRMVPSPLCGADLVDLCFLTSYSLAWSTMSESVSMLHLIVRFVFVLSSRMASIQTQGLMVVR